MITQDITKVKQVDDCEDFMVFYNRSLQKLPKKSLVELAYHYNFVHEYLVVFKQDAWEKTILQSGYSYTQTQPIDIDPNTRLIMAGFQFSDSVEANDLMNHEVDTLNNGLMRVDSNGITFYTNKEIRCDLPLIFYGRVNQDTYTPILGDNEE